MSSENYVRIIMVESLRFLGEGSSAQGKSGAKARPKGVVDAQTVDIPLPPKLLSTGTQEHSLTPPLVERGERERNSSSEAGDCTLARKAVWIGEVPVPQTDTGRRGENPKTNGRSIVKELGKMTP